jgi:serine/threonine protein kinase
VIKVADLGVCNEFLGDDASIDQRTATGTPAFRAPETLSGQNIYFDGEKIVLLMYKRFTTLQYMIDKVENCLKQKVPSND